VVKTRQFLGLRLLEAEVAATVELETGQTVVLVEEAAEMN